MVVLSEKNPKLISLIPLIKKKGVIIRIVIGAVLLIVVGILILLSTRIWDPLWNPFRTSPQKTFSKMLTNMDNLESFFFEINLENMSEDIKDKLVITLNGSLDELNSPQPKSAINFTVSAGNYPETGFDIEAAYKAVRGDIYFKLYGFNLPMNLIFLNAMGFSPNRVEGHWIRFDKREVRDMFMLINGEVIEEQSKMEKIEEKLRTGRKRIFIKKLIDFLRKEENYNITQEFPDQEIEGKKAYHYLITIDEEKADELTKELFQFNAESFIKDIIGDKAESLWMKKQIVDFDNMLNSLFPKKGKIIVEVWIGKKDNFLYQINLTKESNINSGTSSQEILVKAYAKLSNFGNPIEINSPKGFSDFENGFTKLLRFFKDLPVPEAKQ